MRIAILEDDPDQLALLKHWLVPDGHDVHGYLRGRDAMNHAGRESFDLFVLDWQVPDVSGVEVLKWIRDRPELETMLIVILTSSKEDRDIDRAYRLGANSYLVKPPNAAKLQDMVKLLGEYWLGQNQPPIHIEEVAK